MSLFSRCGLACCALKAASAAISSDDGSSSSSAGDVSAFVQASWPSAERKSDHSDLVVSHFVRYFDYTGPLTVSGTMTVSTEGKAQTLRWDLNGVDSNCGFTAFPNGPVSNDCGVHIHVGTSCDEDAQGHYHAAGSDPWTAVHYKVSECSTCHSDGCVRVETGLDRSDIRGRTMIVHDLSGKRIACGIIEEPTTVKYVVKSFVPYFNYLGPLRVSGTMTVATTGDSQLLSWNLKGQDSNCGCAALPNGDVSNDCGIHIHVGKTCTEDAEGHLYKSASDPWTSVHYHSAKGASAASGVLVNASLTADEILGRSMIVHDITGTRIACGIIEMA